MKHCHKIAFLAGLGLILSGCAPAPTFLNPASSISAREANLYNVILIMALVVFVLVEFCLAWILIRDRKQKGDDNPGNPAYNLPIGYRLRGPLDSSGSGRQLQ